MTDPLGRGYLPLTREQRDSANDYLAGMAARGFGCTVEQAIRLVTDPRRIVEPSYA